MGSGRADLLAVIASLLRDCELRMTVNGQDRERREGKLVGDLPRILVSVEVRVSNHARPTMLVYAGCQLPRARAEPSRPSWRLWHLQNHTVDTDNAGHPALVQFARIRTVNDDVRSRTEGR